MARFTLILKFHGKTYICQETAVTPHAALRKQVRRTDAKSKLFRELADKKAAAIGSLMNCWFSYTSGRGKSALMIIVKTAE